MLAYRRHMETQEEIESLVRRLVDNPHDQAAITQAHRSGQSDPRLYAGLLERVGKETLEPSLASHWFTEAATFGNIGRISTGAARSIYINQLVCCLARCDALSDGRTDVCTICLP